MRVTSFELHVVSFEIQIEWLSAHTAVSRISARPRDISLIEFLSQIDETAPPARSRTVPARAFELQYYTVRGLQLYASLKCVKIPGTHPYIQQYPAQ